MINAADYFALALAPSCFHGFGGGARKRACCGFCRSDFQVFPFDMTNSATTFRFSPAGSMVIDCGRTTCRARGGAPLPSERQQQDLFDTPDFSQAVEAFVRGVVVSPSRPSPAELIAKLDKDVGPKARWDLERVIRFIADDQKISRSDRDYLSSLLAADNLAKALRGEDVPESKKISSWLREAKRCVSARKSLRPRK